MNNNMTEVFAIQFTTGKSHSDSMYYPIFWRILCLLAMTLSISACGGGSDDDFVGWQPGVYANALDYYQRCQNPRSGTNPSTGQPYSDVQGSIYQENNFLRSYSNDTYLWYDELPDIDPASSSNPLNYFDWLRTSAQTPSNTDKDRFHFTYDSNDWFQLSQSGVSIGYGAQFVILSDTPPRQVVVAYTEPGSPATLLSEPLERGDLILEVDGVDIDDITQAGIDSLNAGLFPEDIVQPHTFKIQERGSVIPRMIVMTAANVTSEPVQSVKVFNTASGDVGYFLFNDHIATAEAGLIDAVNQLKTAAIDDLVVDIRYNGGGFLDLASQLAYMIAGDTATMGKTFEALQFNDKHPTINPVTGDPLTPTPFHDATQGFGSLPAGQSLPSLDLPQVFVLTGPGTCSASEAIMNGLRGVDVDVIQIGSTTCGKPYGFYPTDNCGTTYFTIQFRGVNELDFGDYSDGFSPANQTGSVGETVPGCSVADDFTADLGDASEARLAAALGYRENMLCPAPSGRAASRPNQSPAPLSATHGLLPKSPWLSNRILRP